LTPINRARHRWATGYGGIDGGYLPAEPMMRD
jgi:hypothetical protein